MRLHQIWLTLFAPPWRSPKNPSHPTYGPTKLLFHVNGWSWLMLHNFLNPLKQATVSISPLPPRSFMKGSQAHTSSCQPTFTAWLCLRISKPSTSSSHLRLLYSSGRVTLGKTQLRTDLALHHWGNHRACVPTGQLHTMSKHHQLILYRGWRLVVSGHSKSLQLTSLS